MNIPVGKIIIGLLCVMAILLGIAFLGNGQPSAPATTTPEPEATTPPPAQTSPPTEPQYNWEISGLTYRITEKAETWWKFSWQATLKNNTSHQVNFFVDINYLDRDGYIIDSGIINPPIFNPNEQRTVRV